MTGSHSADVEVRTGSIGDPTECCIRGPHAFLGYTDTEDDGAGDSMASGCELATWPNSAGAGCGSSGA